MVEARLAASTAWAGVAPTSTVPAAMTAANPIANLLRMGGPFSTWGAQALVRAPDTPPTTGAAAPAEGGQPRGRTASADGPVVGDGTTVSAVDRHSHRRRPRSPRSQPLTLPDGVASESLLSIPERGRTPRGSSATPAGLPHAPDDPGL